MNSPELTVGRYFLPSSLTSTWIQNHHRNTPLGTCMKMNESRKVWPSRVDPPWRWVPSPTRLECEDKEKAKWECGLLSLLPEAVARCPPLQPPCLPCHDRAASLSWAKNKPSLKLSCQVLSPCNDKVMNAGFCISINRIDRMLGGWLKHIKNDNLL